LRADTDSRIGIRPGSTARERERGVATNVVGCVRGERGERGGRGGRSPA